jgi:hypothetical protein
VVGLIVNTQKETSKIRSLAHDLHAFPLGARTRSARQSGKHGTLSPKKKNEKVRGSSKTKASSRSHVLRALPVGPRPNQQQRVPRSLDHCHRLCNTLLLGNRASHLVNREDVGLARGLGNVLGELQMHRPGPLLFCLPDGLADQRWDEVAVCDLSRELQKWVGERSTGVRDLWQKRWKGQCWLDHVSSFD